MKKINADISVLSLLFWMTIVLIFYILLFKLNWPVWFVGFAPIYSVIQIIILKMSNYKIGNNELVIYQYFKKYHVELDKIKSYTIKESNFFKQLLTGFPRKTIYIKYNKYDSIEILTSNQDIINTLHNKGYIQ